MHCKSLWIKASAKCLNVNVNVTSAKNINVHLTAQAHQWRLIVGLSRFAQEKQLKGYD